MSFTTTCALQWAPASAAGVAAPPGSAVAWDNGAWGQVIASTATDIAVVAIVLANFTDDSGDLEVQVGVGAAASEVVVGTFRLGTLGKTMPTERITWPIPVTIAAGSRVAVRSRGASSTSAHASLTVAVGYYANFDSTHVTTKVPTYEPTGAAGVSVTTSGTAWANGAWATVTSGFTNPSMIGGIAVDGTTGLSTFGADMDHEVDIGRGNVGAEVVVATCRINNRGGAGNSSPWFCHLPAVISLPPTTRVAFRVRRNAAAIVTIKLALLYYDNLTITAPGFALVVDP